MPFKPFPLMLFRLFFAFAKFWEPKENCSFPPKCRYNGIGDEEICHLNNLPKK
jgi:hypothetical protein